MREIYFARKNSRPFLAKFLTSLPVIPAGFCQRTPLDEVGITITQMGKHNRSEMFAVLRTTPKSNSNKSNFSDNKR
jgi:hypothetical protein